MATIDMNISERDGLSGNRRSKFEHYVDRATYIRIGTLAKAFGVTRKEVIELCLQSGLAQGEVQAAVQVIAKDHNVGFEVNAEHVVRFRGDSPENDDGARAEYEALAKRLRGMEDNREYAEALRQFVNERTGERRAEDAQLRRLF